MNDKRNEILRQQLELLAERSKQCKPKDLPGISKAMLKITIYLSSVSQEETV